MCSSDLVSLYVGLFGTVWDIMHAFTSLAGLQQVTLATVAPGIAEALVATALGLFTAILDDVYAPSKNRYGARSQMLHAGIIGFKHPSSRQYMEFSVEPPEEFNNVLMRLRKENLINDPVL